MDTVTSEEVSSKPILKHQREVAQEQIVLPEFPPEHTIGAEIVRSTDMEHQPWLRPRHHSISQSELSRRDRFVILCGQLQWLREQAERGIPIPTNSLLRAERLARALQCEESEA